jgi:hypothetical protein
MEHHHLYAEIEQYLPRDKWPFPIKFITSDYVEVERDGSVTPITPGVSFLVENNPESRQIKLPKNGFTITTINRPRREQIADYIRIMGQVGTVMLLIKPFVEKGQSSIFSPFANGGVIMNVIAISQSQWDRI